MENIDKEELRVAKMVRSTHFDGFQENWHHTTCFLRTAAPFCEADVDGLGSLRWEDQEKLRKKIASCACPGGVRPHAVTELGSHAVPIQLVAPPLRAALAAFLCSQKVSLTQHTPPASCLRPPVATASQSAQLRNEAVAPGAQAMTLSLSMLLRAVRNAVGACRRSSKATCAFICSLSPPARSSLVRSEFLFSYRREKGRA